MIVEPWALDHSKRLKIPFVSSQYHKILHHEPWFASRDHATRWEGHDFGLKYSIPEFVLSYTRPFGVWNMEYSVIRCILFNIRLSTSCVQHTFTRDPAQSKIEPTYVTGHDDMQQPKKSTSSIDLGT